MRILVGGGKLIWLDAAIQNGQKIGVAMTRSAVPVLPAKGMITV